MSLQNKQKLNTDLLESHDQESRIAQMLNQHYGDGFVYVCTANQRSLYQTAKERGFLSSDGYLTKAGRLLLAHYDLM